MGPALVSAFTAHGARVISDARNLAAPESSEELIAGAGEVDVLIVNLAIRNPRNPFEDVTPAEWREVFAHLVDPLPRLFGAVLPQMIARGHGKIVVMGSASALRGMNNASTYSAARGAQVSYVRAIGTEVASRNVQVNLIAQNFVDNETYFPPDLQATDGFKQRLQREVPVQRLATPEEDALFAIFLASSEVNFFAGQSIPFAGGWVT
tara:strand:+ start:141566 stop:142189 length:624 start_codon:yes stop_codon:yes gene_type:complete